MGGSLPPALMVSSLISSLNLFRASSHAFALTPALPFKLLLEPFRVAGVYPPDVLTEHKAHLPASILQSQTKPALPAPSHSQDLCSQPSPPLSQPELPSPAQTPAAGGGNAGALLKGFWCCPVPPRWRCALGVSPKTYSSTPDAVIPHSISLGNHQR